MTEDELSEQERAENLRGVLQAMDEIYPGLDAAGILRKVMEKYEQDNELAAFDLVMSWAKEKMDTERELKRLSE